MYNFLHSRFLNVPLKGHPVHFIGKKRLKLAEIELCYSLGSADHVSLGKKKIKNTEDTMICDFEVSIIGV